MKNTTTHTPGPWKMGTDSENVWIQPQSDNAPVICELVPRETVEAQDGSGYYEPYWMKEDYANARLIAAAPELLEAIQFLEMIASTCFDTSNPKLPEAWRDGIMNARAAIEKATGDNKQEPDETSPLETYKGFDVFETGGRKLTAYEKDVPNHPRTVVAYSLPDIKNLIDYMTEDDEAAEPDSDNQARDYQDAQEWAEQPTPYDP